MVMCCKPSSLQVLAQRAELNCQPLSKIRRDSISKPGYPCAHHCLHAARGLHVTEGNCFQPSSWPFDHGEQVQVQVPLCWRGKSPRASGWTWLLVPEWAGLSPWAALHFWQSISLNMPSLTTFLYSSLLTPRVGKVISLTGHWNLDSQTLPTCHFWLLTK
jgi:hypothetical protein